MFGTVIDYRTECCFLKHLVSSWWHSEVILWVGWGDEGCPRLPTTGGTSQNGISLLFLILSPSHNTQSVPCTNFLPTSFQLQIGSYLSLTLPVACFPLIPPPS